MKILFLCTAFNSLSQRLALVLRAHGHHVTVELALSPEVMADAAEQAAPNIIICPFLTRKIPATVYNRWLTLVVHPGPPGDAGPSALDYLLFGDLGEYENADAEHVLVNAAHCRMDLRPTMRSHWGVTVLQAVEAFDAGPVWAYDQFRVDQHIKRMTKSDLYRGPVTIAAINAVLAAIEIIRIVSVRRSGRPQYSPELVAPEFARTHCASTGLSFQGGNTFNRPLLKASARDFFELTKQRQCTIPVQNIVQRIRSGDSQPGVLSTVFGSPLFLYGATAQTDPLPGKLAERARRCGPGTVLATRDGAVLVEVGADHPIWISHLRKPKAKSDQYLHPKLPATMVLMSIPDLIDKLGLLLEVEEWPLNEISNTVDDTPWKRRSGTYQQVWVDIEAFGEADSKIGYIHAEFYNGAFSTSQCEILLRAINWTLAEPDLKAIVMLGGSSYFSNGIALNVIEGSPDPSAEAWVNINAIDDCVQALLAPSGVVTFAAIRGNAAAGGLALATAADVVLCAETAVLNPHYRAIGLYGSEFHTYSWYERCGADVAAKFARDMLPMSALEARKIGLVDYIVENEGMDSDRLLFEIKTVVKKIMTTKAVDVESHIGAPWTRPLRPAPVDDQISLSLQMLRNKVKFLAYTFAGDGSHNLSIEEHFQKYRKHELDEMALDFFHSHRNKRFAQRCTAFVRKVLPIRTPMRLALHRRYESAQWDNTTGDIIHKDEEELDEFDSLADLPDEAVVPRLPKSRPEYIVKPACPEQEARPTLGRNGSVDSTDSSLCSDLTAISSSPETPRFEPRVLKLAEDEHDSAKKTEINDLLLDGKNSPCLDQDVKVLDLNGDITNSVKTTIVTAEATGGQQLYDSQCLWSCYYTENGGEQND